MKKYNIIYLLVTVLIACIFNIKSIYADYSAQVIKTTPCQVYKDKTGKTATGSCIYSNSSLNNYVSGPLWVDVGDKITVITSKAEVKAPTSGYGSECKTTFVYMKITYNSKTYNGYVCKDILWDGTVSDEMKQKFKDAGFYDETYYNSLTLMQLAHPNWQFKAVDTQISFDTAVKGEDSGKKSLLQVTSSVNDVGYLSTKDSNYNYYTDKFTVYDGSNWYAANYDTIAYYMDPRNFLKDNHIFMFETIYDNSSSASVDLIKSLLSGSYIEKYAQNFFDAGKSTNVSAVYLASLSKQEMGTSSTYPALTGNQFTYGGKTYKNLYNFYNIGATSGSDGLAVYRGLVYANGGADGSQKSYSRPWNTPEKAILGGAQFIYSSYINKGQFISYFKKFNTVYYYAKANGQNPYSLYTNQYMQNIQAPRSEAYTTFTSYSAKGQLDNNFIFYIPVYRNMPEKTSLPAKGNPNNYLKTFTYKLDSGDYVTIPGFDGGKTNYEIKVGASIKNITLAGTTVNSKATITGLQSKDLVVGDNRFAIEVKAQNGALKTYNLNVIKETPTEDYEYKTIDIILKESKYNIDGNYVNGFDLNTKLSNIKNNLYNVEPLAQITVKRGNTNLSDTSTLATGDIITITSGSNTSSYTVVIYGDVNGDGVINTSDMLKIQKHKLGVAKLTGVYLKSADANRDGVVNTSDMLKIQKHKLGLLTISQV